MILTRPYTMGVITINKFVKMILLLLSYLVVLIALYNFTGILQGNDLKDALFMIVLTTIYSYLSSAIDKETFRIKFSWFWVTLYIVGAIGFVLCSGLDQNSGSTWVLSFLSTALLITGVVRSNG